MYPIEEKEGAYYLNNRELTTLVEQYGAPLYVYDLDVIKEKYRSLRKCIGWQDLHIFYAMKANWNRHILKTLLNEGCGVDTVSIGEIKSAKKLGFPPEKIIYTANNITDDEMEQAVSEGVLINIGSLSRLKKTAARYPGLSVMLRFNPDVVAGEDEKVQTGGNLSKFGILLKDAPLAKEIAHKSKMKVIGLHEHTGSGIKDAGSVYQSMKNLLSIADQFPDLEFIDFGGGFAVPYMPGDDAIDYNKFGQTIYSIFDEFCTRYGKKLKLFFEPGKYLVAQSGLLLAEVNTLKENEGVLFAGVNSGFSQLIRPVLYNAYQHITNLSNPAGEEKSYNIAGNICESGDLFAKERMISEIREGDILAISNAGAYCYSMGSFYNFRPMPAEVVLENGSASLSRGQLSYETLIEFLHGGEG